MSGGRPAADASTCSWSGMSGGWLLKKQEIPVDHAEVGSDGKTADEVIVAGNTEASGTECRSEGGVVLDLKNDNGHVEGCPPILRVVNEAGWRLSLYKQADPEPSGDYLCVP